MFLSEQWFLQRDLEKKTAEWWKQFIALKLETSYNCCINSSIVSEGAMNSFKEIFPLARMFPLPVMHRVFCEFSGDLLYWQSLYTEREIFLINKCVFLNYFLMIYVNKLL